MAWRFRLKAWAYLPPGTANAGNYGVMVDGAAHIWTWRPPATSGANFFVDVWAIGEGQMAAPVQSTIARPAGVHTQAGQTIHVAPGRFTLAWKPPTVTTNPDIKVRSYEVTDAGAVLAISADVPMVAAYRAATGRTTAVTVDTSSWYDRASDQVHVLAQCSAPVSGGGAKFALVYCRVNADGSFTAPYVVDARAVAGGPTTSPASTDRILGGAGVPRSGSLVVPVVADRLINNVVGDPVYWASAWIDFGPTSATIHILDQGVNPRPVGSLVFGSVVSDALLLTSPARSSGDFAHFIWDVRPANVSGLSRRRFVGVKADTPLEVGTSSNLFPQGHVQSHSVVPDSSSWRAGVDPVFMEMSEGDDQWYYPHPDGVFEAGERQRFEIGDPVPTGYFGGLNVFLRSDPITMVYRANIGGSASDSGMAWIDDPAWTLPDDYPHGAPVAPSIQVVEHLPSLVVGGWHVGYVAIG